MKRIFCFIHLNIVILDNLGNFRSKRICDLLSCWILWWVSGFLNWGCGEFQLSWTFGSIEVFYRAWLDCAFSGYFYFNSIEILANSKWFSEFILRPWEKRKNPRKIFQFFKKSLDYNSILKFFRQCKT